MFVVVSLLFAISCGDNGCSLASCDTVARAPTSYTGKPDVNKPYMVVKDMTLRDRGCTNNLCSYWAGTTVVIHNPTTSSLNVAIKCIYTVDDGVLGTPYVAKTKIPSKSSRQLEGFDLLFDLPANIGNLNISVECTIDFGKDFGIAVERLSK